MYYSLRTIFYHRNKMSNVDDVNKSSYVLQVRENDGSKNYYELDRSYVDYLIQINNKKYKFGYNIYPDGSISNIIHENTDIDDFINKFRH